jgi:hypothetical protein
MTRLLNERGCFEKRAWRIMAILSPAILSGASVDGWLEDRLGPNQCSDERASVEPPSAASPSLPKCDAPNHS